MCSRWGFRTKILVGIIISGAAQAQPAPIFVPPSIVAPQQTQMAPIVVPPSVAQVRPTNRVVQVQPAPIASRPSTVQVSPSVNQLPPYTNQSALSAQASGYAFLRPSIDSP